MSELEQSLLRALKKAVQQRDCLVQMLAGIDKTKLLEMLGVEDSNRCMDILRECEE